MDLRTNAVAGKEGVYCVGDACAALIPSAGVPIPKAGEFAYKAGLALGKRLAALVRGEEAALPTGGARRGAWPRRGGGEGASRWGRTRHGLRRSGKRQARVRHRSRSRTPTGRRRKVAWIQGCSRSGARPRQGVSVFEAGAPRDAES